MFSHSFTESVTSVCQMLIDVLFIYATLVERVALNELIFHTQLSELYGSLYRPRLYCEFGNMSFYAIRENKSLAKVSEFTVTTISIKAQIGCVFIAIVVV